MKNKRSLRFFVWLVAVCCLWGAQSALAVTNVGEYCVRYYDFTGALIREQAKADPETVWLYTPEDVVLGDRVFQFDHWKMEMDAQDRAVVMRGFYMEKMEKTAPLYTNYDVFNDVLRPDIKNHILVVYVSFQGEAPLDRQAFEQIFFGETDADHALYSVESYFRYASYGRDLLDFSFAYYDCDMTVEEAWHYVNDEDKKGNFVGNRFLFDIFKSLQKSGEIDTTKLDADKNGYVDGVIFVIGDHLLDNNCYIYGGAQGHTDSRASKKNPVMGKFIKMPVDYMRSSLKKGSSQHEYTRMVIHELGHMFGLMDYYDFTDYEGTSIDTLGLFDMQCEDNGDWNPFSRFTCGWLSPYVITEDIDQTTLLLRCSSLWGDAILLPTSLGWNGTPFDEYILVDVMAPAGANGYDWSILVSNGERIYNKAANTGGGVRVLHVDARLCQGNGRSVKRVKNLKNAIKGEQQLHYLFSNSNGYKPYFDTDSRFYHLVDWIPADGSSKFRLSTPLSWSIFTLASTNDLFAQGKTFSTATCQDAFVNGEKMNNGGTLNWEVIVESYDAITQQAIVTVKRIR